MTDNDRAKNACTPRPTRREVLTLLSGAGLAMANVPFEALAASPNQRTAVVIGSGVAGLSAAWELQSAGFAVVVLEKNEFPGGRMRDAWIGRLRYSPHALGVSEANREMFALAADLGIADQLAGEGESDSYPVDNGIGVYSTGLRFHVDEVARIPGISPRTRSKLALLAPDLAELGRTVDPCLIDTGAQYDDESLREYYERLLGPESAREVIDWWIEVVLQSVGWPVGTTSKVPLLTSFAQQRARFVVPKGGIGVLTRKLASLVDLRLRHAVRYVTPPDARGRHTVHYLTPEHERKSITPDVVVVATEGKYIPSLVQGLTPDQDRFFKRIDFTKACGAIFVLDPRLAPKLTFARGYTATHPDPVKRQVAIWTVNSAGHDEAGPPPTASLTVTRTSVFDWQASGKTQQDYCLPLLLKLCPSIREEMITDIVVTGCDDLVYMPVGYARDVAKLLRAQERQRQGLYFAGEYVAGAHTGAACASGRSVARCITRHWGNPG